MKNVVISSVFHVFSIQAFPPQVSSDSEKKVFYPDRQRQVKSEDGLIHMMQEMH